jgi:hypothetical protein
MSRNPRHRPRNVAESATGTDERTCGIDDRTHRIDDRTRGFDERTQALANEPEVKQVIVKKYFFAGDAAFPDGMLAKTQKMPNEPAGCWTAKPK